MVRHSMQGPAFMVHAAREVRAVLALGAPVTLLSAPGAAGFLGAAGFMAMLREGGWEGGPALLDCGAGAGWAWAALAAGVPGVVLADCAARDDIAARFPGRVLEAAPPARDMAQWDARRGDAWLREWLRPGQSPHPASR